MEIAKLRVSEQLMFEEEVCAGCFNAKTEEDAVCGALAQLAAGGECSLVYERDMIDPETGSFYVCMMRRAERDPVDASLIKGWVAAQNTEEVKEVYDHIVGSWHFDTVLFESEREK